MTNEPVTDAMVKAGMDALRSDAVARELCNPALAVWEAMQAAKPSTDAGLVERLRATAGLLRNGYDLDDEAAEVREAAAHIEALTARLEGARARNRARLGNYCPSCRCGRCRSRRLSQQGGE